MCGGGGGDIPLESYPDDQLSQVASPREQEFWNTDADSGSRTFNQSGYDEALGQYNAAQAELQRRQQVRDQLNQLAAERQAAAAAQQQQLQDAQLQSIQQSQRQQQQVAELQSEQANRLAGVRAAGTAATQSLQILGNQPSQQGPTAQVSTRKKQGGGVSQTQSSLRMGSTQRSTGVGTNLSI